MSSTVTVLQSLLAIAGALAGLQLAARIHEVASVISSFSLRLLSIAFMAFSFALFVDAIAPLLYQHPHQHAARGIGIGMGRRPEEILFLMINRASMLAQPLYMIAYTLYTASIYSSHLPLEGRRLYSLPLIALVYMDYNIVALGLLGLAGYMVYTRGAARPRWLLFYVLLATSHALAIAAMAVTSTTLLTISTSLRALAPLILVLSAGVRGQPLNTLHAEPNEHCTGSECSHD